MVEKLWNHALTYLENYSVSDSENGFEEFFDFEDETGILNRLSQMFASCSEQTPEQVDIKIMFYELIRLICDFENQESRNGSLRQICKIDGFQQLSNKLFLHKMKSFSLGLEKIEINLPKYQGLQSTAKANINSNIEQRLTFLEKSNLELEQKVSELEKENLDLITQLKEIKSTSDSRTKDQFVKKLSFERPEQEQLQKSENKGDEKDIFSSDLKKKINDLEQADLYLQETNKIFSEKVTAFESVLKISSCSNDETRKLLLSLENDFDAIKTDLEQCKFAVENNLHAKNENHQNKSQSLLLEDAKLETLHHTESSNLSSSLKISDDKVSSATLLQHKKTEKGSMKSISTSSKQPSRFSLWLRKRGCLSCVCKPSALIQSEDNDEYCLVQKT